MPSTFNVSYTSVPACEKYSKIGWSHRNEMHGVYVQPSLRFGINPMLQVLFQLQASWIAALRGFAMGSESEAEFVGPVLATASAPSIPAGASIVLGTHF